MRSDKLVVFKEEISHDGVMEFFQVWQMSSQEGPRSVKRLDKGDEVISFTACGGMNEREQTTLCLLFDCKLHLRSSHSRHPDEGSTSPGTSNFRCAYLVKPSCPNKQSTCEMNMEISLKYYIPVMVLGNHKARKTRYLTE